MLPCNGSVLNFVCNPDKPTVFVNLFINFLVLVLSYQVNPFMIVMFVQVNSLMLVPFVQVNPFMIVLFT